MFATHTISLLIGVLLCVVISMLWTRTPKEHFSQGTDSVVTLREQAEQVQRDAFGVEACSLLNSESPQVGNEQYGVMNAILKGFRFNKWKPSEDDPQRDQVKADKAYCYIYNDVDNNIADYMLSKEGACDISNPLFAGNPMVSRVFTNSYTDKTHALPIQKCVVELEPNQVTPSNVNSMWSKWGSSHCTLMSESIRQELDKQRRLLVKAEEKYNQLMTADKYIQKVNEELTDSLSACGRCNEQWSNTYAAKMSNYVAQEDVMKNETVLLDRMMTSNYSLRSNNEKLTAEYDNWRTQWETQSNLYGKCRPMLAECRVLEAQASSNYQYVAGHNRTLTASNQVLQKERTKYTTLYNEQADHNARCEGVLRGETDKKTTMYNQLIQVTDWYNACNKERSHYASAYATYSNMYTRVYNDYNVCDQKRVKVNNDLRNAQRGNIECSTRRGQLEQSLTKYKRDFVYQEALVAEMRGDLKKNQGTLFECQRKKSKLESVKNNLLKNNVRLYNELEIAYQKLRSARATAFNNQKGAILGSYAGTLLGMGKGCQATADELKQLEEQANKLLGDGVDKGNICKACQTTEEQCAAVYKNDAYLCKVPMNRGAMERKDAVDGVPK